MTLILSLATADFALQVSDRRLTQRRPDGTLDILDENANKAVLVCHRAAFGYSGWRSLTELVQEGGWRASWPMDNAPGSRTRAGTSSKRPIAPFSNFEYHESTGDMLSSGSDGATPASHRSSSLSQTRWTEKASCCRRRVIRSSYFRASHSTQTASNSLWSVRHSRRP